MARNQREEVVLDGDVDSITIRTPQGLVMVSHIKCVGTTVCVYDDPEHNPLSMTVLREEK